MRALSSKPYRTRAPVHPSLQIGAQALLMPLALQVFQPLQTSPVAYQQPLYVDVPGPRYPNVSQLGQHHAASAAGGVAAAKIAAKVAVATSVSRCVFMASKDGPPNAACKFALSDRPRRDSAQTNSSASSWGRPCGPPSTKRTTASPTSTVDCVYGAPSSSPSAAAFSSGSSARSWSSASWRSFWCSSRSSSQSRGGCSSSR